MATKHSMLDQIKGKLVVSCQALPDEPLHSPFIMGRMALAVSKGGAAGLRANGIEDIREIKRLVTIPIIGIIKRKYEGSDVYITPTMKEVDELYQEGVDMIAMDATGRIRPGGMTIAELFPEIRRRYKDQLFMADCATYEEGVKAAELGFDCIGTTLSGYTEETKGRKLPDLELIERLARDLPVPVIAEGSIQCPDDLKRVFAAGAHAAVVGSAITRPMEITRRFVKAISPPDSDHEPDPSRRFSDNVS